MRPKRAHRAGQLPAALLIERSLTPKKYLLLSYALNIAAFIVFFIMPQLSIVLTGVASAIYHVAGGTVCAQENKAFRIGYGRHPSADADVQETNTEGIDLFR